MGPRNTLVFMLLSAKSLRVLSRLGIGDEWGSMSFLWWSLLVAMLIITSDCVNFVIRFMSLDTSDDFV